ncbi:MAG: TRAP transporter large permease subunit [Pseudomonadota bacterium]
MPPVMGVAAIVLAALTGVGYAYVIVAAAIPAVAYFTCLFLSVVFQARKQKITAIGALTPDMHLSRQDILNLAMIFGPTLTILLFLLTSKEAVGCGLFGWLFGVERVFTADTCRADVLPWGLQVLRNAAGDAGSAGWWAVLLLMGLLFVEPAMRARPRRLLDGRRTPVC